MWLMLSGPFKPDSSCPGLTEAKSLCGLFVVCLFSWTLDTHLYLSQGSYELINILGLWGAHKQHLCLTLLGLEAIDE